MRCIFNRHIFFFVLLIAFLHPGGTKAQQPDKSIDTNYFSIVDAANYDSLLHTFYMQQYLKSAKRHQDRRATQAYADFDNIPDSVFIKRLQDMHMVVPMTYNSEVRAYIKLYVRIMSRRLNAMLSLTEYYFPFFEETLDRYGVPEELKYLTIVESALNPQATSRADAAGLWQFMYSTGKDYDLEISSLVDERRDPFKSTVAAAKFLHKLHEMYGDWQLAMAAYNCGPGNVNKAIARSGGKNNFWQIYSYLPRETRGYIPAYIGATYVMNYYHEHGLTAGKYEIPLRTDTLHLHGDVHFAIVEKLTGITVEQLRQLNPQYRADIVPASTRTYAICLPSNKTSVFINNEDSIYKASHDTITKNTVINVSQGNVVYHKVKKGDTFNSIAKKYGVSVGNLRSWNGKGKKSTLKVGTKLKIYLPAAAETTDKTSTVDSTASVADSVKNDKTMAATDSSATANKKAETKTETKKTTEKKETKATDKKETKKASKPKTETVYHTVRKGENLSSIAKKYNTTVAQIKKLNNMKKDMIQVGQKLKVK